MTTKNTLTHSQVYKLTRWLEEKHSGMSNLTQAQIADLACAYFDFQITSKNISHIADILEIKVGYRSTQINLSKQSRDVPRTIARHLVYLYTKLGEPVPFDLQDIATR